MPSLEEIASREATKSGTMLNLERGPAFSCLPSMFTPSVAFAQGTVPGVDRSLPVALPLAGGCLVPGAWIWKHFAPGTPARIRWKGPSPGHVPALEVSG